MSFNPLVQFATSSKETLFDIMQSSREATRQSLEAVKALGSQAKEFIAEHGTKVNVAIGTSILANAPDAEAAVTFAEGTGFAGTVDMTFFYSAVPLVVTAMVAVAAVGLGIKMFRRV